MTSEMPYEEIATNAIAGRLVVVFCASLRQADEHERAIAATARRLGARNVVSPRRDRRVDIDNSVVRLVLNEGRISGGCSTKKALQPITRLMATSNDRVRKSRI